MKISFLAKLMPRPTVGAVSYSALGNNSWTLTRVANLPNFGEVQAKRALTEEAAVVSVEAVRVFAPTRHGTGIFLQGQTNANNAGKLINIQLSSTFRSYLRLAFTKRFHGKLVVTNGKISYGKGIELVFSLNSVRKIKENKLNGDYDRSWENYLKGYDSLNAGVDGVGRSNKMQRIFIRVNWTDQGSIFRSNNELVVENSIVKVS